MRDDRATSGNDQRTSAFDQLNRPIGLSQVTGAPPNDTVTPFVTYDYTGGGRMVGKRWGADSYNPPLLESDLTAGGIDRYGRLVDLHFTKQGDSLHRYEYGYDESGNRLFARIKQAGHDNDRSFLYDYDP